MAESRGMFLLAVCFVTCSPDVARTQPLGASEVTAIVYSNDGKTFSSHANGYVRVRDGETERMRVLFDEEGVNGIALSADGKRLLSAEAGGQVRLCDAHTLKPLLTFVGHGGPVAAVAFAPGDLLAASAGYDGSIRIWDVATGQQRHVLHGHEGKITAVAFSPDGKTLASGAVTAAGVARFRRSAAVQSDHVRLWEVKSGKPISTLPIRGQTLAFHPDGRTLVMGGNLVQIQAAGGRFTYEGESHIIAWDVVHRRERLKLDDHATAIALSPDGELLATGWGTRLHMGRSIDQEYQARGIHIWELATGKELLHFAVKQEAATVLAFAPDGTHLAAGQQDGQVVVRELAPLSWKAQAGKPGQADVEKWWKALGGQDAARAYAAGWSMAQAKQEAVALLKERLQPAREAPADVQKLIADLDSGKFSLREAASRELRRRGSEARAALEKAVQGDASVEFRRRVNALLKTIDTSPDLEQLRQRRALRALEQIATKDARDLLQALASGTPEAPLTIRARAALARLSRQ